MARLRHPAVVALFLAPILGEWLSTASPPIDSLWPPATLMLVALYGCGALLCREIARRHGLGLRGLCVLAAAYGVWEEALVDRFWFHPRPSDEGGLGTYSEVWHTNVLLATNLTVFHIAVSIVSTIVLVELLFPGYRERPWLSKHGLVVAAVAFFVLPPALYGEYTLDPAAPARRSGRADGTAHPGGGADVGHPSLWDSRAELLPPRRGVVPVAFVATAANFLLMGLSDIDAPWPLAVLAVLAPVLLAFLVLRTLVSGPVFGRDGLRVVTGILGFYCVFAMGIGLTGRYDITVGALLVVLLLWRMRASQVPEHAST